MMQIYGERERERDRETERERDTQRERERVSRDLYTNFRRLTQYHTLKL